METRDTGRRFEQWAHNPQCEANAASAILGVSMVDVAKREGLTPSMGQSPFALQRGQRFERQLFRDDAEVLRAELEQAGVLPAGSTSFADFRLRQEGGTCRNLEEARERTVAFVTALSQYGITRNTPALLAGATIRVPGARHASRRPSWCNALVVREADGRPELLVGEIKTYPNRGGHPDRAELSGARAQLGVYAHDKERCFGSTGWRNGWLRGWELDLMELVDFVLTTPQLRCPLRGNTRFLDSVAAQYHRKLQLSPKQRQATYNVLERAYPHNVAAELKRST